MAEKHSPRPPSMLLLFAMIYAGQMASTIYLPGLPEIARDLDATMSAAQTLVAAYLGAFAFSQLVMGPLPGAEKRVALDVSVESETDCGTYVRREITYVAEPGARVPAFLLIPKDVLAGTAVRPGVIAAMPTNNLEGNRPVVGINGASTKPNRDGSALRYMFSATVMSGTTFTSCGTSATPAASASATLAGRNGRPPKPIVPL